MHVYITYQFVHQTLVCTSFGGAESSSVKLKNQGHFEIVIWENDWYFVKFTSFLLGKWEKIISASGENLRI